MCEFTVHLKRNEDFIKFDSSKTSDDFLNDGFLLLRVNETISKLESSLRSKSHIDDVYTDWCTILKGHMLKHLQHTRSQKRFI